MRREQECGFGGDCLSRKRCDLTGMLRIERPLQCYSDIEGDVMRFTGFAGQKYLNLETFRKSGQGVKTPVWFAAEPSLKLDSNEARLYVYTVGVSGKVKRIRNNPGVTVAPCDMRGRLRGSGFRPGRRS